LLDTAVLAARSLIRLPQSLPEALERFQTNPVVTSWFPEGFADVYWKHERGEMAYLGERSQAEICEAYEQVY
jgi:glutamine synthetase